MSNRHTMIVSMGASGIVEHSPKGVTVHHYDGAYPTDGRALKTLRGRMKSALGIYPTQGSMRKAKRKSGRH